MGAFDLRGTGRTTKLLERICETLYCGNYDSVIFVVPNNNFIRYAAMLVQHHCQSSALFNYARNTIAFRNEFGKPVYIQFVPMDNEARMVRGYRNPIARDHEVLRRRGHPTVTERRVIDELSAAGIDPWKEVYIPKQLS